MNTERVERKEMFVTIFEGETPRKEQTKEAAFCCQCGCDAYPGVRKNASFCCQTGCDR